jgi:hypothetical protein
VFVFVPAPSASKLNRHNFQLTLVLQNMNTSGTRKLSMSSIASSAPGSLLVDGRSNDGIGGICRLWLDLFTTCFKIADALIIIQANPTQLNPTVASMEEIINLQVINEQTITAKVHALSVLKEIALEKKLELYTRPMIGRFLETSIQQLSSSRFAIHDSSMELLLALLQIIFGKKSDHPLVYSDHFFAEFPNVYKSLSMELQKAVSYLQRKIVYPSLYPVLTALRRIKPKTAEQRVPLVHLIDLVKHFSHADEPKIRSYSAKTLASLVHPDHALGQLQVILAIMQEFRAEGYMHGCATQVLQLIKKHWALCVESNPDSGEYLAPHFQALRWLSQPGFNPLATFVILECISLVYVKSSTQSAIKGNMRVNSSKVDETERD